MTINVQSYNSYNMSTDKNEMRKQMFAEMEEKLFKDS